MGATQSAPQNIRPRQIERYTNYTYTNPSAVAGAASIYDYRYKTLQANPGESEASRADRQRNLQQNKLDDQFCTLEASVSPINPVNPNLTNDENMRIAKSLGGINAVKNFYNNIHLKANESGMKNTDRAQYIKQCYGKQLSVQADADPAIIKGLPVATTECGAKARYIRIWGNGTQIQNFAQVVVTDARGENVARGKPTTSFSTFQQDIDNRRYSHTFAVDGTYSSKRGDSIYAANSSGSNEFWEVDLQGTYDIVQIVFYNRSEVNQSHAIGMKLVLYPDGTTPQQRTRDYSSTPYSTTAFTSGEVQFFSLAQTGASSRGCPAFSTSQRGNILTENTKIKSGESTFKDSLDTSSKPVFVVSFNGRKDTTQFNGAEYIWNEPYGAIKSKDYGSSGCTFWTSIENTTRTPKQYTFYFRVNGDVGFISLNRVNLTIPTNANNSHNSAAIPSVLLILIPGINIIQINITKRTGVDSNCWIGSILSPDNQYINQTTVDIWKSSTAPQLGTFTDSAASSSFNPTELSRKIFTNDANMGEAKWLWNQALAAISFADINTVHFYTTLTVSGSDVKTYTFRSQVDDKLKLTVNGMIYQEMTNTEWSTTEYSKPIAKDIQIRVVPGANLIQVDCENTAGAAGFRAVIRDERGTIVRTTNATDWRMTTAPLKNFETEPCGYVADSLTDIPVECGQSLLDTAVGSTKSTNLSSDGQWNAIKSQSRSQLNTLFTTDAEARCQYYKNSATDIPKTCGQMMLNAGIGTDKAVALTDAQWNLMKTKSKSEINTLFTEDSVTKCLFYKDSATDIPKTCGQMMLNAAITTNKAVTLTDAQWNAIKTQTKSQINSLFTTDAEARCQYYKDTVTGLPLVCRQALINAKLGTKAATISGDTLNDKTRTEINTMLDTDDVNRCPYYNSTSTDLPWPCYNEVFKDVCGRDITQDKYREISGTGSALRTDYTKNTFREYIENSWASRSAGGDAQTACKGTTVCDSGYKYIESEHKCYKNDSDCSSYKKSHTEDINVFEQARRYQEPEQTTKNRNIWKPSIIENDIPGFSTYPSDVGQLSADPEAKWIWGFPMRPSNGRRSWWETDCPASLHRSRCGIGTSHNTFFVNFFVKKDDAYFDFYWKADDWVRERWIKLDGRTLNPTTFYTGPLNNDSNHAIRSQYVGKGLHTLAVTVFNASSGNNTFPGNPAAFKASLFVNTPGVGWEVYKTGRNGITGAGVSGNDSAVPGERNGSWQYHPNMTSTYTPWKLGEWHSTWAQNDNYVWNTDNWDEFETHGVLNSDFSKAKIGNPTSYANYDLIDDPKGFSYCKLRSGFFMDGTAIEEDTKYDEKDPNF